MDSYPVRLNVMEKGLEIQDLKQYSDFYTI